MSSPGAPRLGDPRRRLRARLTGAALLTLPLLELALLITTGRVVGVPGTLALLVAGVVAGILVLRRVGVTTTRRLPAPPHPAGSAAGGPPGGARAGEPFSGLPVAPPAGTALLVPAGLLLIVPGLLSDAAGLVLLIPAVRRALAARLGEAVLRRLDRNGGRAGRIVPGEVVTTPADVVDVQVTDVRPRPRPGAGDGAGPRALE